MRKYGTYIRSTYKSYQDVVDDIEGLVYDDQSLCHKVLYADVNSNEFEKWLKDTGSEQTTKYMPIAKSYVTDDDMMRIKKYEEFAFNDLIENHSISKIPPLKTIAETKMGTDKVKIYDLIFDKSIVDFLNYDNMDMFIKNIDKIEFIGNGIDSSTVFEISNEKGDKMVVAYKNNNFYRYVNKVKSIYPDFDLDASLRKISEIDMKIKEKENEQISLIEEPDIFIDDNTMELISNYSDKIKNYYNEVISNSDNLDVEKGNLETLMNAEILKI